MVAVALLWGHNMGTNLFYYIGGSDTNVASLGQFSYAYWTPETDEHFERYTVQYMTSVNSWGDFETFEGTLATQLALAPLVLETYPRGRARVISLSNSGGTLVNSLTGTSVSSVFVESIEAADRTHWGGAFNVTFVKARKTAMNTPNLFYRVGGSAANTIALGSFEDSDWTPQVDGRFERYECQCITNVTAWGTYEQYEASLANSLALGPIETVEYPRGGGRVVSFSNSGGTLYNATTGTTVASVFPESVDADDHGEWTGRFGVTFVRAR